MESHAPLGLDGADPLVAIVAWGLTEACSRLLSAAEARRARRFLPAVAVAIAVALRAAYEAVQGEPMTVDVLLRGAGAAGIAVLTHSQLRELRKGAPGSSPSAPPPGKPGT